VAGGGVLDAAQGYAAWARGMLGSRASRTVSRDLRIALGELHSMIGLAHHDAGLASGVRQNYL